MTGSSNTDAYRGVKVGNSEVYQVIGRRAHASPSITGYVKNWFAGRRSGGISRNTCWPPLPMCPAPRGAAWSPFPDAAAAADLQKAVAVYLNYAQALA